MNIKLVDAERIIKICSAISYNFDEFEKICEFLFEKKSNKISSGDKNHVSRAISTAQQLNMIRLDDQDVKKSKYEFLDFDKFNPQIWNDLEKSTYFRLKLQEFAPFLRYFDFVSKGFTHKSAASNVSSLFSISPEITGENNIFRRWGTFADVFSEEGLIKPDLSPKSIEKDSKFVSSLLKDLDTDLKCRTFIREWLGDDAYNFIDEDIRKDLVFAINNYKKNPDLTLAKLGNALEDHIKLIAKTRKIKLEDAKGKPLHTIGQMINVLRSNKILADHHTSTLKGLEVLVATDVLNGLNAYRKMTSHGKNVDSNQRWSLSSEIGFVAVLQTILVIKSTYYYTIKNKLSY